MHYDCLLKSDAVANLRYVGLASNLEARFVEHNSGNSPHTSNCVPWKLVTCVAFSDRPKAEMFERYLKLGSGQAFARKRLW